MMRIGIYLCVLSVSGTLACAISASEPIRSGPSTARVGERARLVVSSEWLDQHARRPTDETVAVRDEIDGVEVYGRFLIRGTTRLVLVDDEHHGVVDVVFSGAATSKLTFDASRVRVHNDAVTQFTARQRFCLDDDRLTSSPTVAIVETRSRIVGVDTRLPRLRGRIARAVGWQRARAERANIDRKTEARVASQIRRQFEDEVAPVAARVREALASDFLRSFAGNGSRLRWRSTSDGLLVAILREPTGAELATAYSNPTASTGTSTQDGSADLVVVGSMAALEWVMGEPRNAWLRVVRLKFDPIQSGLDRLQVQSKIEMPDE